MWSAWLPLSATTNSSGHWLNERLTWLCYDWRYKVFDYDIGQSFYLATSKTFRRKQIITHYDVVDRVPCGLKCLWVEILFSLKFPTTNRKRLLLVGPFEGPKTSFARQKYLHEFWETTSYASRLLALCTLELGDGGEGPQRGLRAAECKNEFDRLHRIFAVDVRCLTTMFKYSSF